MRRIIGSYQWDRRRGQPAPAPSTAGPGLVLVIDTNVWLDLLVFDEPTVRPVGRVLSGGTRCLATAAMREELDAVLRRPQFALDGPARAGVLRSFDARIRLVDDAPDCRLDCADPDDQKFLDVATAHRADWLLSHDKALLRARRHARRRFGLEVGTPAEFLGWLAAARAEAAAGPCESGG